MAEGGAQCFRVFEDLMEEVSLDRTVPDPSVGVDAGRDRERLQDCLRMIDGALRRGAFFAGALSYEAGVLLQGSHCSVPERPGPLIRGGLFRRSRMERMVLPGSPSGSVPAAGVVRLGPRPDRLRYRQAVDAILDQIRRGEVYQANLTFPVTFLFEGRADRLFASLYCAQPARMAAELVAEDLRILSLSPELFFSVSSSDGGRTILCRPMKGTAPRSGDATTDGHAVAALQGSAKERAENAMIVDLIRNDIGRVCTFGSVDVRDVFHVEALPRVFQMTTTVSGRLREEVGLADLFSALLPSGSVTGAPKQAAISLLHALESGPRGFYTGAMGWASAAEACWNVPIRTVVLTPGERREGVPPTWHGALWVGSGITIDSRPGAEFGECMDKVRFFRDAVRLPHDFFLYETVLFRGGRMRLRPEHAARLEDSARAFSLRFCREHFDGWLDRLGRRLRRMPYRNPLRLHIRLKRNGRLRVWITPLPARRSREPRAALVCAVAPAPVCSDDIFFRHKTSVARHFFDRQRSLVRESLPACDEVLFVNERGELTEGSFTNLLMELDGRWFTPPVSAGLLNGLERGRLLQRGRVMEQTLRPADLRRGARIVLANSVRGLWAASLVSAG